MYDTLLSSVLWYASWPVLIVVSYFLVRVGLRLFEKKQAANQRTDQPS